MSMGGPVTPASVCRWGVMTQITMFISLLLQLLQFQRLFRRYYNYYNYNVISLLLQLLQLQCLFRCYYKGQFMRYQGLYHNMTQQMAILLSFIFRDLLDQSEQSR